MVDSLTIVTLKLRPKDLFALISNGQKVNEALLGSHYGIVAHTQIHLADLHVFYQANQICEPSPSSGFIALTFLVQPSCPE